MKENRESNNYSSKEYFDIINIPKTFYSYPIKKLNKKGITICWCFTIICWITLIICIYLCCVKKGFEYYSFGVFIFFYLIYLIFEILYSFPYFKSGIFTIDDFINYMKEIIKKPIQINLSIYSLEKKKSINKIEINYYSVKDISGLLIINLDKIKKKNFSFFKLSFLFETNIADEISYHDYLIKIFLLRKNKKFINCDINIKEKIKGLYLDNFIYLSKKCKNVILNKLFLCISIIFTFSEIIKYFIESYSYKQTFKIRKLISFREDLNKDKYYNKYKKFIPLILINHNFVSFKKNETVLKINENYLGEIKENEIEKYKIFSHKIKKFEIQDFGFESAIIKDKLNNKKEKNEQKKIEEKINYEINKETDIILCKKEIKNDKYYLNGNMNISLRSDDTKIEINKEKVLIFSYEDSYNNDDDNLIKKESEKKNPLSDNNIISTDGSWKKI